MISLLVHLSEIFITWLGFLSACHWKSLHPAWIFFCNSHSWTSYLIPFLNIWFAFLNFRILLIPSGKGFRWLCSLLPVCYYPARLNAALIWLTALAEYQTAAIWTTAYLLSCQDSRHSKEVSLWQGVLERQPKIMVNPGHQTKPPAGCEMYGELRDTNLKIWGDRLCLFHLERKRGELWLRSDIISSHLKKP